MPLYVTAALFRPPWHLISLLATLPSLPSCLPAAVRVLKLMLERLGCDFSHSRGVHATAGPALQVLNQAAGDPALRTLRPSALAAAVLLASRKSAGGWQHTCPPLLARV